jgi:hypothetical protein
VRLTLPCIRYLPHGTTFIAPILATHPLLSTLIKAHIDNNQCNLYLPFLHQLWLEPSPCSARKEKESMHGRYLGNSIAPEDDISINRCRGHSSPSHARGIHNFVAVRQSLQQLPSTSFIPQPRGPCVRSISYSVASVSLFVIYSFNIGGAKWTFC